MLNKHNYTKYNLARKYRSHDNYLCHVLWKRWRRVWNAISAKMWYFIFDWHHLFLCTYFYSDTDILFGYRHFIRIQTFHSDTDILFGYRHFIRIQTFYSDTDISFGYRHFIRILWRVYNVKIQECKSNTTFWIEQRLVKSNKLFENAPSKHSTLRFQFVKELVESNRQS